MRTPSVSTSVTASGHSPASRGPCFFRWRPQRSFCAENPGGKDGRYLNPSPPDGILVLRGEDGAMNAWTSDLFQDVRFAARTFAKRPGFTAVAAITLALGIGATTAVFSIVHAVLLRPLPYKDPDRLAAVWITSTREGSLAKIFATYRDYSEFRRSSRTLDSVSAATWAKVSGRGLTGFGPARDVLTIPASASFLEPLAVTAAIGRTFRAEDEGHGCSVVVAHKFWTTTLRADASIVGKSIPLDQTPCTVLGVMPERF